MPSSRGLAPPVQSAHFAERRAAVPPRRPRAQGTIESFPRASEGATDRRTDVLRRQQEGERRRVLGPESMRTHSVVARRISAPDIVRRMTKLAHLAGVDAPGVDMAPPTAFATMQFPGRDPVAIRLPGADDLKVSIADVSLKTTPTDAVPAAFLASPMRWVSWILPTTPSNDRALRSDRRGSEEMLARREGEESFALTLRLGELIRQATVERIMEDEIENRVAAEIARRNRRAMGLLYLDAPTIDPATGLLADAYGLTGILPAR